MKLDTLTSVRLPAMSIRIMSAVLDKAGIDSTSAFRAAHLPPADISGPQDSISGDQEIAFQRAFVRLTEDRPGLWMQVGMHYRMLSYGAYGLSVITSPSFQEAIQTALCDDVSYSLAHYSPVERRKVIVGLDCDLSEVPPDLREFTILRDWAGIVTAFQDFWNEAFPFTRIELAAPKPVPTIPSPLHVPGSRLVFDSHRTTYRWNPHVHRRPMMHANPILHEYYGKLWAERIPAEKTEDLIVRIAREIRETGRVPPSLSALARRMGYSRRTLQRRLKEEGLTFRKVVSETRRQLAMELLEDTRTPISEIAWRLGYSEVASFNHAFRRWTDTSPHVFRQRSSGSGPRRP